MATEYALGTADSMADCESDFETEGLEVALDHLCERHCCNESSPKSKSYCAEFCQVSQALCGRPVQRVFTDIGTSTAKHPPLASKLALFIQSPVFAKRQVSQELLTELC